MFSNDGHALSCIVIRLNVNSDRITNAQSLADHRSRVLHSSSSRHIDIYI